MLKKQEKNTYFGNEGLPSMFSSLKDLFFALTPKMNSPLFTSCRNYSPIGYKLTVNLRNTIGLLFYAVVPVAFFKSSQFLMDSSKPKVIHEVVPYLRVYEDGTIERLLGTEVTPAAFDPQTGVVSTDVVVVPETGVSARLYRPKLTPNNQKLPLVVYFHGGAFCISSAADPKYHHCLNTLVATANVIAVSVNYRRAPEHPLPAAYDDSWAVLQWVASHSVGGEGSEAWVRDDVDFERVFLVGDSAGANIAHHLALRIVGSRSAQRMKLVGIGLIHPYFWGEDQIGSEAKDPVRKAMVDKWWQLVCPSGRGNDDPLINPFVDGAPSFKDLGCDKVLVCVAERDILRDRGRLYYETLVKSGWGGTAEMVETEGEDHVFHIFQADSDKARSLVRSVASFINH